MTEKTDHADLAMRIRDAASEALPDAEIGHVESGPMVDSDGEEALRVVVTLRKGADLFISGHSALGTVVAIQDALRLAGETRFAHVDFLAEDEPAFEIDS